MSQAKSLMMRYMPMMVSCQQANQFIDDYLSGELPRKQRVIFDWHLRLCPDCREYLNHYRQAIDLCRDNFYTPEEEPAEVPERILKGIMAAKRAGRD